MDLNFTEEQDILRDSVRSLCADFSTMEIVRQMENDPEGIPADFWEQMKDTGIVSILLPEEYGGMGLNMVDCAIIYEELGRALAPTPHFVSAVMAVLAISKAGSDEQKNALLPALGSGDLIVTPAWLEAGNGFGPNGVQLRAEATAKGHTLNGTKHHVSYAAAAKQLLVLARNGDSATTVDLFLVDRDTPGVELEQQLSMASDTQYKVTFTDVEVPEANRIGSAGSGWETWESCMYEGIILLAAQAVGGADRALEMTVEYSKEREQFDKPIGSFQALAHYMADCSATVAGARVLVHEAAWAHSHGISIKRLAPMAKLFACNTFRDTTAKCEQIYGGYGFTLGFDIQLYFRRAKQQQMNWWDSRYLEDLIAADVLDSNAERTIADPFAA